MDYYQNNSFRYIINVIIFLQKQITFLGAQKHSQSRDILFLGHVGECHVDKITWPHHQPKTLPWNITHIPTNWPPEGVQDSTRSCLIRYPHSPNSTRSWLDWSNTVQNPPNLVLSDPTQFARHVGLLFDPHNSSLGASHVCLNFVGPRPDTPMNWLHTPCSPYPALLLLHLRASFS